MKMNAANNKAFTLLEIIVTLSIMVVLTALMVPALKAMRENSKSAKCMSNLRQIGLAMNLYINENSAGVANMETSGVYPPGVVSTNTTTTISSDWSGFLSPYVGGKSNQIPRHEIFMCPSMAINNRMTPTYGAHARLCPVVADPAYAAFLSSRIRRPGDIILVADVMQLAPNIKFGNTFDYSAYPTLSFDAGPLNPYPAPYTYATYDYIYMATAETPLIVYQDKDNLTMAQFPSNLRYRHKGSANVLFCDGRVASMPKGTVKQKNVCALQY